MRYVLIGISIIAALLLQVSVFPMLPYLSVTPNLLLILTISFAIMYGQMYGLFIGLICGLLADVYSGGLIGLSGLILACAGYINGSFARSFDYEDFKLPAFVILLSDLIYGIIMYPVSLLSGGSIGPVKAFLYVIIPEVVFTGLLTVFLYPLLIYFNRVITARSRRRVRKFTAEK